MKENVELPSVALSREWRSEAALLVDHSGAASSFKKYQD
jgi:hypothetical protein